jgi:4-amino-4-deoxy-L-arabinose transferase-like glycosyltransferase
MNWPWAGRALDGAVPLGFGLVLCLTVPLRTAFEFGADEGFELMKAFLVSRGHPLYTEIWNDQPPLHTEWLALLFRVFGPTAYVGRLLTVGFAMLLVGALYQLVKPQAGRVGGCLAVALLVSSASFLQLSVSVMLELPALSLAVVSLWLLLRETGRQSAGRWMGSGVAFGCALQIKLTAALFLPALLAGFLMSKRAEPENGAPLSGAAVAARIPKPGRSDLEGWENVLTQLGAVATDKKNRHA